MATLQNIYLPLNLKQFFELVQQLPKKHKRELLGILQQEEEKSIHITDEQKKIVRQRIKKYDNNPELLIEWNKAKKMIKA